MLTYIVATLQMRCVIVLICHLLLISSTFGDEPQDVHNRLAGEDAVVIKWNTTLRGTKATRTLEFGEPVHILKRTGNRVYIREEGWLSADAIMLEDKAVAFFETQASKASTPASLSERGIIRIRFTSNVKGGVEDLYEALRLDTRFTQAHKLLAEFYFYFTSFDRAIVEVSKLVKLYPEYGPHHSILGHAYFESKRYEDAIQEFTKHIALDSEAAQPLLNRAAVYFATGQRDLAKNDALAVLRLMPRSAEGHFILGQVEFAAGNMTEANAEFTKAIESDDNIKGAWRARMWIYESLGEKDLAQSDYEHWSALPELYLSKDYSAREPIFRRLFIREQAGK